MSESADETIPQPLVSDVARQAVPSIRGYAYQVARSALAWAHLEGSDVLYLEGAEDFDRIGRDVEAVQVKDLDRALTLRSSAVVETIANCWTTRQANPGRNVRYRLLTTARATVEQGNPFGQPGIALWNELGSDNSPAYDHVRTLAEFLLANLDIPSTLQEFLRTASPEDIHLQVIEPLRFDTGLEATPEVEQRLKERLAYVGMHSGLYLSNTVNALNGVLKAVWDTITRDAERILTPTKLISVLAATTQSIAPAEIAQMKEAANKIISTFSALVGGLQPQSAGGVAIAPITVFQPVPPLPTLYLWRDGLIERVLQHLSIHGVAVISGLAFSGKSLLAVAAAQAFGGEWRWVSLTRESDAERLHLVVRILSSTEPAPYALVIDNIQQGDTSAIEALALVLHSCKERGIRVIVVIDGAFNHLVRSKLDLGDVDSATAPFEHDEIEALLRQVSCPEPQVEAWTKIVELSTLGDPLFVSGRVQRIVQDGFPAPNLDDVFSPKEISELRRDVRLVAVSELDAASVDLMNRLSVGFDVYPREVVFAIAKDTPAIANAGNVLDSLVGVWVNELDEQRYQICPIALNFGQEANGVDWARRQHSVTARAFLTQSQLTTAEVSAALRNALAGHDDAAAHDILLRLGAIDDELFANFIESSRWLLATYVGDVAPPDYLSPKAKALLRLTQLRIASGEADSFLGLVEASFEAEYPADSSAEFVRMTRMIGIGELLLRGRMRALTSSQIARYANEWATLAPEFIPAEFFAEVASDMGVEVADGRAAALAMLGFVAIANCNTASDVEGLVAAVVGLGADVARSFFAIVDSDRQVARGFLIRIWGHHFDDDAGWRDAVDKLCVAFRMLSSSNIMTLADECGAAAVRLGAERSADAYPFVELANDLLEVAPDLSALQRAKARALMLATQYSEAAKIWTNVLPVTPWDGTDFDLHQDYRDLAISCSMVGDWCGAADALNSGSARLSETHLGLWKAAMEIDSSFALWKAGEFTAAVTPLMNGATRLASLSIDLGRDADFMVLKRIGHTVARMADPRGQADQGFAEPPAGSASWLDITRPPDMAATTVDLVLALAMKYAFVVGDDRCGMFEARVRQSGELVARAIGSWVAVFRAASSGATTGLISLIATSDAAKNDFAKLTGATASPDADQSARALLILGVLRLALDHRINEELLATWRGEAQACGHGAKLKPTLDAIEGLFVTEEIDADVAVRDSSNWELQLLASFKRASLLGNEPRWWYYLHALWVHDAGMMPLDEFAGALIYPVMAARWRILSQNPIVLVNPAHTVPGLQSALDTEGLPWSRIAALIDAAANACGETISADTRATVSRSLPPTS